jgi:hypothetical protein
MQECSWMQLVEYARPQSPSATRRRRSADVNGLAVALIWGPWRWTPRADTVWTSDFGGPRGGHAVPLAERQPEMPCGCQKSAWPVSCSDDQGRRRAS